MQHAGRSLRVVNTVAPLRISFAGGGTDIPSYFTRHGGAVVSATIDRYVYVTVKRHSPLFREAYRLSYHKTEHVNDLNEMENNIARECLRLVHVDPPLFIATASDLPHESGLGSSASFAVALLYALHTLKGEDVSAGQLAEEACHVEIDLLKRPTGKQDQYAAAFGGLNYMTFGSDGRVGLDPLWMPNDGITRLFEASMLFWTGQQRDAGKILAGQVSKMGSADQAYASLRELADVCRDELLLGPEDFTRFGALLDAGWRIKQSLHDGISANDIDRWYEKAMSAGALGGKILGAGGGGFLYLAVPLECRATVRAALSDVVDVPFHYDPRGARVLSTMSD